MTPCCLAECYQYFGGKFCLHRQSKLGVVTLAQTSRHLHRVSYISWRHKRGSVTNTCATMIA
jgi:hypothetical protein